MTAGSGRRAQEARARSAGAQCAILSAASKVVREEGVRALSASPRCSAGPQLSTRAFYRHFDSKDQLVSAVFLEMARVEMLRLRQRMAVDAPTRFVRWRRGSTGGWTWPSTTRSDRICARCRSRRSRRCSRHPRLVGARLRRDPAPARRRARARKGSGRVHRHRSRQRGPVDSGRRVGQRRTALGDRGC